MSVYTRPRRIRYRHLGDETLVLRQSDAHMIVLNELGGRILELAEGRGRAEIVDALLDEYDVERPQLKRDVEAFLEELVAAGLLAEGTEQEA